MKIVPSLLDIPKQNNEMPGLGLTIGNFDGVHIGHRELLKKIKRDCLERNISFAVVTFIPHPQKILKPEMERFLISSYEQRRTILKTLGVDYLVEMKFTRDFSTLTPEQFLTNHLLCFPNLKNFYLGYDFAFGANKQGGFDQVKNICRPHGVHVEIQPKFEFNNKVVSSSLIRDCLLSGRIHEVEEILARPFHLEGLVVKGEGRGKKIGYPTANIQISSDLLVPHNGVYVTRTIYKEMVFNSVTNIGHNPTFKDSHNLHIETHLFDFDTDIYGEMLDIQFLHKIRNEIKFPSVNDLILQIKSDAEFSKDFLKLR